MAAARANVGFVGLGMMGWPMARNLAAAGYTLTVHDADGERSRRFVLGARRHGGDPFGRFASTDVVVTMLPDDKTVQDAILHWDGGIARVLPGRCCRRRHELSNPVGTKELGAQARVARGRSRRRAGLRRCLARRDWDATP